jgi:hypothetical protein
LKFSIAAAGVVALWPAFGGTFGPEYSTLVETVAEMVVFASIASAFFVYDFEV